MRQVLQSLGSGQIEVVTAPAPLVRAQHVLIETRRTLISAGTERMLLKFGRGNLLQKAQQQPEKVRQTLQKIGTDGLASTLEAVRAKLDQPVPLGYCNAGVVHAVGAGVTHVRPGDRVVSNGPHAELVVVGHNLVSRIPDGVSDEAASFTPLAAIALQGCRLAAPALGETFCVIGLGLVGLLAVQLLKAHGCRVIGVDFSPERLAMARLWGAECVNLGQGENPVDAAMAATGGVGVDGVLIAAATDSDEPLSQAARMCRKRGRIVLVGVIGPKLSRAEFYEKELSFQVSCSYGPGRYDPDYEDRGHDYPIGFVRWTEQRNFDAVLGAMAAGQLDVSQLVSGTFPVDQAGEAYERLADDSGGDLGLIITYPENAPDKFKASIPLAPATTAGPSAGVVAMVGAGGFGGRVTAPGLKAAGADLRAIVSRGGVSAVIEGRKAGFQTASSDFDAVLADDQIDTVVITTRHDSHAAMTTRALAAGKNIFVEKPLALTEAELDTIETTLAGLSTAPRLMVGFNRRFSPFSVRMKELLDTVREPKCLVAIINAGAIPAGHWVQDPVQGGGRIVGEACHFIDLMRYFVGAPIVSARMTPIGKPTANGVASDKATITLTFDDGSIGSVHYFANGPQSLVKERFEAFAGGNHVRLDNFTRLEVKGWPRSRGMSGRQDKGHAAALKAFMDSVRSGGAAPIPLDELLEVSRWSIRAAQQMD